MAMKIIPIMSFQDTSEVSEDESRNILLTFKTLSRT